MVFPEVAVLRDDFERADEDPVTGGGRWSGTMFSSDNTMKVQSGKCLPNGAAASARYVGYGQFTPRDLELFVVIGGSLSVVENNMRVRWSDAGVNGSGYRIRFVAGVMVLERIDSLGGATTLAAPSDGVGFAAGDAAGARITGMGIEGFARIGGDWARVCAASDPTYLREGYVGIGASSTGDFDAFYAGIIQAVQPNPPGIGGRGAGW